MMEAEDGSLLSYDGGTTERIIGLAIKVHRHFGPGLMELAYEACLCHELRQGGFATARQVALPLC